MRIQFIMRNLQSIAGCFCRYLEPDGTTIPEEKNDPVICDMALRNEILQAARSDVDYLIEGPFCIGHFAYQGRVYLLGPCLLEYAGLRERQQYAFRHHVGEAVHFPCIDASDFCNYLDFFFVLITGEYAAASEISMKNEIQLRSIEHRRLQNYLLKTSEEQLRRMPYSYSRILTDTDDLYNSLEEMDHWDTGIMSHNPYKQEEYKYVGALILTCQTIISKGVDENTAHSICDLILQDLSAADSVAEMKMIYRHGAAALAGELKKLRNRSSDSYYIKKTKRYIAENIDKKLSTAVIAKELGLSSGYLSDLFAKETGETISGYIIKEKIRRGCELLSYSDYSLTDISNYLQITPLSYFSRVFKRVMGVTPGTYRKNNRW